MLNHVLQRPKLRILLLVTILCVTILITHLFTEIGAKMRVSAQDNERSIRSLLLRMNQMRRDDPGFVFVVGFVNPLIQDELAWTIGDPEDQFERTVDEVGEDYVCFREHTEGADLVRCTPFHNILDISFIQT